jgi:transcriptional regulator with XRE-family HTH domain
MTPTTRNFGHFLRGLREKKQLGLNELARKAQISPTFLSLVERGMTPPPGVAKLQALAEILGQDVDTFLGIAGKLPPDVPDIVLRHPRRYSALLRSLRNLNEGQLDAFITDLSGESAIAIEAKNTKGVDAVADRKHYLLFVDARALDCLNTESQPTPTGEVGQDREKLRRRGN